MFKFVPTFTVVSGLLAVTCIILCCTFVDYPLSSFIASNTALSQALWVRVLRFIGAAEFVLPVLLLLFVAIIGQLRYRENSAKVKGVLKVIQLRLGLLLGVIISSGVIANIIKFTVGRPRPAIFLTTGNYLPVGFSWSDLFHSFPSGHATTEASIVLCLCWFFPKLKYVLLPLGIVWLSTSVLILAHWVSDVIAGILLAYWCYFIIKVSLEAYMARPEGFEPPTS